MTDRTKAAEDIARKGGALALNYFAKLGSLEVEDKGPQDFVTEADKNVETHVRELIGRAFPDDGIVGEEHAPKPSQTGYTWVIDPIDGTANFVSAIPAWCVVIAIVKDDRAQTGVIYDPIHDEMFAAERGRGAHLNGAPLVCPPDTALNRGSVGTGYSSRISVDQTIKVVRAVLEKGGVFHRNASGALSLAYVSAGRLIGYIEEHMNAWDCLAGQLLIAEAGGRAEDQSATTMIADGGRVVAGSKGVFDDLVRIADDIFPAK
ncbi:MAG: inositol monophosphatase [Silicimonas sp.]|nr:inositol monophosphatase [Silicimonas sp.]